MWDTRQQNGYVVANRYLGEEQHFQVWKFNERQQFTRVPDVLKVSQGEAQAAYQRVTGKAPKTAPSLHSKNSKGEGNWQPLTPLVTPGGDPMHATLNSRGYQAIELNGSFGKLGDVAAENKPDTVSIGGKITVCAAPIYKGEEPCKTFDVAARFKVYTR